MDWFYRSIPREPHPFDPTIMTSDFLLPYLIRALADITHAYLCPTENINIRVNMFMSSSQYEYTQKPKWFLSEHLHFVLSYWSPDQIKAVYYTPTMRIDKVLYFGRSATRIFLQELSQVLNNTAPSSRSSKHLLLQFFTSEETCRQTLIEQRIINRWVDDANCRPCQRMSTEFCHYLANRQYYLSPALKQKLLFPRCSRSKIEHWCLDDFVQE